MSFPLKQCDFSGSMLVFGCAVIVIFLGNLWPLRVFLDSEMQNWEFSAFMFFKNRHFPRLHLSTNGKLLACGPVVWDSRGTPFHNGILGIQTTGPQTTNSSLAQSINARKTTTQ